MPLTVLDQRINVKRAIPTTFVSGGQPMKNSWETLTVDNSPMRLYMSQPEGPGPFPAIVVMQNQDGVQRFYPRMSRRVRRGRLCRHRAATLPPRRRTQHSRGNCQFQKYADRHQCHERYRRDDRFSARAAPMSTLSRAGHRRLLHGRAHGLSMPPRPTTSFKAAVDFYGGGTYSTMGRPARTGDVSLQRSPARSKVTSANSTKIRRRTRCASSMPS